MAGSSSIDSFPAPASPRAIGLTGENKPNGLQYRLRQDVPPETPAFIPRTAAGLELWIADRSSDGWLAFYREPLGTSPGSLNSRYHARFQRHDGSVAWALDLHPLLSAPTHLEIQDVRYSDGELYVNEACQSYSLDAGGRCSALLRVDPSVGRVVWRTRDRVSNDTFLLHGEHVVSGYGFTAEPDSIFLVDRETGRIQDAHPLESAHSYLEVRPNGRLVVITRRRAYELALP